MSFVWGYVRVSLTLMVVAVLSVLVCFSIRYAVADYYFEHAKYSFGASTSTSFKEANQFESYINLVDSALAWRDGHVDALDFKADLLYQSWWLFPDGQSLERSTLLRNAVGLHLKALKLRPGWAFSSARLALIYSNQVKLDNNFEYWFTESHRLGLYETIIARSLMEVGLQNWDRLTDMQRSLTVDFIRTSIEQKSNNKKSMIAVLNRYGKRDLVCSKLPSTPRKLNVCV